MIACLEQGAQGTPHYQGYLELRRHQRQSFVKTLLPQAHLEVRRGKASQAATYCLKDLPSQTKTEIMSWDQTTYTGDFNVQLNVPTTIMICTEGHSLKEILSSHKSSENTEARLKQLKTMIEAKATDKDLADADFEMFIRYSKGLNHYRMITSEPRNHETEVIVIQGPTGTGKSKYCMDNYPNAYWKQRSQWWDNYVEQDTVILDEFYAWLPYDTLLRLCDRYPLLVECKGGQVNFNSKTIVITTNSLPESWYKNVYFKAFIRRVTKWIVMPVWAHIYESSNYEEALAKMVENRQFTEF